MSVEAYEGSLLMTSVLLGLRVWMGKKAGVEDVREGKIQRRAPGLEKEVLK